jgi:2',3'-cyclic-nucleotide 2'-phosphodiesterase (5'-nucleotidase family)
MRQSLIHIFSFLTVLRTTKLATASTIEPTLPIGEINVLVITDVHSWVAGHGRQEPQWNADYGDVLSFYERLKEHCDEHDHDLWFVSNGDFVHGTGLSAPGDPSSLIPVLQKLPLDALNCGNHELYEEEIVDYMIRPGGWVDWWGDRYLTGNVRVSTAEQQRPLGHLYKYLRGKHSNLLVYGFLYNMEDACESIEVEEVEVVVEMPWFREALVLPEGDYAVDAVLVLAHMDLKDPLVDVIRKAIRHIVGDKMPIQFITGHTHYRGEAKLDDWSTSFEAGKYLDTVGFVSFPTRATAETPVNAINGTDAVNGTEGTFQSVFMDANKQILSEHLGLDDPKQMATHNGIELSNFVRSTREKMGLVEDIGCAPQDYIINASMDDEQSLWRLYRDEVIPKTFFTPDENDSIMFLENEAWRYDLRSHAPLIVDDIMAVAPFNDTVVHIGSVPGSAILQLNASMNNGTFSWSGILPNYILIGGVDDEEKLYHFYTHDFNAQDVLKGLGEVLPGKNFVVETTQFSSTMLWLAFVSENWPCNGQEGKMPDWFPTPESVAKQLGKQDDEQAKKVISIVMSIGLGVMFVVLLRCGCVLAKYICGGFTPVMQEELEDFKMEEDEETLDKEEAETWDEDFINIGEEEEGEDATNADDRRNNFPELL